MEIHKLAKKMVALTNSEGGIVLLGVTNDGRVKGADPRQLGGVGHEHLP